MENQEIRLLIIDDIPENLDLLSRYLENLNYRIFVTNDAQDILEHPETDFTHSFCPDCLGKWFGNELT